MVAGSHVAERARQRDRLAVGALAHGRRPDGELEAGRRRGPKRENVTSSSISTFEFDHVSDDIGSLVTRLLGLPALLVVVAVGRYLYAQNAKSNTSPPVQQAITQAQVNVAATNFQGASTAMQAFFAQSGTYAGAALPPGSGVILARADAHLVLPADPGGRPARERPRRRARVRRLLVSSGRSAGTTLLVVSTGPLRAELVDELEALKFALADMSAGDIAADDAGAIAVEISAIRLQLKRLAFERQEVQQRLERHAPSCRRQHPLDSVGAL